MIHTILPLHLLLQPIAIVIRLLSFHLFFFKGFIFGFQWHSQGKFKAHMDVIRKFKESQINQSKYAPQANDVDKASSSPTIHLLERSQEDIHFEMFLYFF
jgi:tRNA A37 methylthiotransferase MiaB